MKITVSKLENVEELKTITAISTFGTGLLTAVVTYFVELLGIENVRMADKNERAKKSAIDRLIAKASNYVDADGIMNLRLELSGKTVLAYGTVYKSCATVQKNSVTNSKDAFVGASSNSDETYLIEEIPEI